ncbi:MAG: MauE/DoxX family redox-associated membrane protein [Christiangramia sp.]|uniref:DoxX family protein n=1 Tax=Christiangramia sp. TaxID=1931228 RepID=UPI0032425169
MAWHLILMAVIYIAAGINHFIKPKIYVRIIPDYLPAHAFLVYLSGIFEIALGIMLFWKDLRPFAIWGIILMLIVFFSVHIHMLRSEKAASGLPKWVLILRIPVQFALIYWAYTYL